MKARNLPMSAGYGPSRVGKGPKEVKTEARRNKLVRIQEGGE